DLAGYLANLGILYSKLGRQHEALAPTQEAVEIFRKLVKTNPAILKDLAVSVMNLGNVYRDLGRRHEALAPTQEAVEILRKLVKTNPAILNDLAGALSNLGVFYSELGRRQEALAPTQEAVTIRRELVKTNPAFLKDLAGSLTNQALFSMALGNVAAALPLLHESVGLEVIDLQQQLPLLPEGRRQDFLQVFGNRWLLPFSQANAGDAGAQLALFTRLNRQGLLQDLQRSQALLARRGPGHPLVDQIRALKSQLASVTIKEEERQRLQAELERFEQQLYSQLPHIKPALVEPGQIAVALQSLAPQGMLLEFQRYASHDASKQEFTTSHYLALLLSPTGRIRAIPLGEAAPIDAAVAEAVGASADFKRQAEAPQRLAAVSRLLLAPLWQELSGLRELFISPDGELNRLPFAALPLPAADGSSLADGPTLGDTVALRLLTTGRDLLRLRQPAKAGGPAVLIANPDFNRASRPSPARSLASMPPAPAPATAAPGPEPAAPSIATAPIKTTATATGTGIGTARFRQRDQGSNPGNAPLLPSPQQRSSDLRGISAWQPLAGTEQEARALAPLLGGTGVISGPAATSTLVLQLKAPRILHIATHGFFLADQPSPAARGSLAPISSATSLNPSPSPRLARPATGAATAAGSSPDALASRNAPQRDDPLERSGLVFAGANHPEADPSDDGYLTAAEATAMDLEGTELVTLSACETGLGGVRSGEGVYGLQRSLAVAGARSSLLSLWKVDDALTAEFMQRYYNKLKAGEGRAEALRHTQAEFRNHKNSIYNDIRVWGAFQLSGDWRALPKW
ncbi:MAG: CHAT domain-containing tetratricopeptide repeat protein, partial [Synechococcaceae cyanobacterium]